MSKAVALISSLLGVGGVSATGIYVWKSAADGQMHILPHTVSEFKDNSSYPCIKDYFSNFKLTVDESVINGKVFTPKEVNSKTPLDVSFFQNTHRKHKIKSCLMVSWDRENYQEGKWRGNFRWLWTFAYGNKGFVVFTTAETSEVKSQMNLFGGFYFLKKERDNWMVYRYKELKSTFTNEKKIDVSNFDIQFPAVGNAISKDRWSDGKDHWGFIKDKNDLNNICKDKEPNKCVSEKLISHDKFTGTWEWEPNSTGTNKLSDWSKSSPIQWLPAMYPEMSNLKTVLSNGFKEDKGTWK